MTMHDNAAFLYKMHSLMIPFTLLKKRSHKQKMRAKAQKGGPYHLPPEGAARLRASSNSSCYSTVSGTEPTVIIQSIVSQRMLLRDVLRAPCDTFLP
jgi:hypothetical protein